MGPGLHARPWAASKSRFRREKPFEGLTIAVSVHLEAKTATLTLSKDVSDDVLRGAVTEAGYEVVSIQ